MSLMMISFITFLNVILKNVFFLFLLFRSLLREHKSESLSVKIITLDIIVCFKNKIVKKKILIFFLLFQAKVTINYILVSHTIHT